MIFRKPYQPIMLSRPKRPSGVNGLSTAGADLREKNEDES